MCGIAGIITRQTEISVNKALGAMVDAQRHRGPDDGGQVVLPFGDRLLGLGHRRLSILDLSSAGHQPMAHPERGDQLVFNGEIYNFRALRNELEACGVRFVGHSDTEVLLHALNRWGAQVLSRLQGMYALAYYNASERRLMLARDPMGIKPLYLGKFAQGMAFASEVRAILASGLVSSDIDRGGLAGMLAYGAVQHPRTLFEAIHSFPPGCYQEFGAAGVALTDRPVSFWQPRKPDRSMSAAETLKQVQHTLEQSVRDHLVSDVPVGVFLSSGIDSTVIAGLAAKHTSDLRSFTVGFADQPEFSEFTEAGRTAEQFGLRHTEISISHHEAEEAMLAWLKCLDQPSFDGLNTFVISKAVRERGIKVALSGLGGDELFGGYPSFIDVPRLAWLLEPLCMLPSPLRSRIGNLVLYGKSEAVKDKFHDMLRSHTSILALYLQRRRALSSRRLERLGLEARSLGLNGHYLPNESLDEVLVDAEQPLWSLSQLESRFYMGNMLLRDSDANAMAHGLEIRVPILGQQMVDLMAAVPDKIKMPSGRADKHLLRTAFAPLLRPALLKQAKRGFTLPIRRWMHGPLREQCEHSLASLKSLNILRNEGVDQVWQEYLANPESPMWSRAFALVVLGHYFERTILQ